ncbi:orotate phosphoribosyltransferase [Candidatus Peregrinibacteria bacterium]|jgi:orotate phosphoribosyltransferase|nr:orotate phosphoribosyltransferase [Candidatus Peregrinibacteria bacterium]
MQDLVAKILLEKQAVQINPSDPFTWTSGIKSPIYCDNRLLISYPDAVSTVVLAFKEMVEDMDFDVVAGTATAGIPWAAFLAYELDKPMVYIRKKPKEHGTKSQIEGVMKKGQKVLLVEDLVSTGKSSLAAVDAIRKEGGITNMVAAIFSYGFPIASDAFKNNNCRLETITNFPILLEHLESITDDQKADVLEFSKDPQNWKSM